MKSKLGVLGIGILILMGMLGLCRPRASAQDAVVIVQSIASPSGAYVAEAYQLTDAIDDQWCALRILEGESVTWDAYPLSCQSLYWTLIGDDEILVAFLPGALMQIIAREHSEPFAWLAKNSLTFFQERYAMCPPPSAVDFTLYNLPSFSYALENPCIYPDMGRGLREYMTKPEAWTLTMPGLDPEAAPEYGSGIWLTVEEWTIINGVVTQVMGNGSFSFDHFTPQEVIQTSNDGPVLLGYATWDARPFDFTTIGLTFYGQWVVVDLPPQ